MNNAEKFKQLFGIYATELWAMPEEKFLEWLNAARRQLQEVTTVLVIATNTQRLKAFP